jgi:hypothetical protein
MDMFTMTPLDANGNKRKRLEELIDPTLPSEYLLLRKYFEREA